MLPFAAMHSLQTIRRMTLLTLRSLAKAPTLDVLQHRLILMDHSSFARFTRNHDTRVVAMPRQSRTLEVWHVSHVRQWFP